MPELARQLKEHGNVRMFTIGTGFDVDEMRDEIFGYVDILLGRVEPPIDVGVLTLMELAEAYHARATEMEMVVHEAEADGKVARGSKAYRFRTGQLRSFQELCKRSMDLGSRRVTVDKMEREERG